MSLGKVLDRTIFLGIYGAVAAHPWIVPDEDVYRLFGVRATAMGWAWSGMDQPGNVLWGLNDGGQDLGGSHRPGRFAWVQVSAPLPEPGASRYVTLGRGRADDDRDVVRQLRSRCPDGRTRDSRHRRGRRVAADRPADTSVLVSVARPDAAHA